MKEDCVERCDAGCPLEDKMLAYEEAAEEKMAAYREVAGHQEDEDEGLEREA